MGADMNNPPAFPLNTPKWHESVSDEGFDGIDFTMGMTLRDYFAARAMQVLLAAGINSEQYEEDAMQAYAVADAMLKARNGQA
jgi:hypothetical protein